MGGPDSGRGAREAAGARGTGGVRGTGGMRGTGGARGARGVRALGTRDRVLSYLAGGEISDPKGMASTVLAAAIGYPGSSAAFAQLLSGMERAGLIEREIRGKRTYRITPAQSAVVPALSRAVSPRRGRSGAVGGGRLAAAEDAGDFDYDELARRLLLQVVQRLGAPPEHGSELAEDLEPEEGADSDASLAQTVASLEHKLATVRSKQQRLTEENARLREQLRAAQESLAQARERTGADRVAGRLDSAEAHLLDRLLSSLRDVGTSQEQADAG